MYHIYYDANAGELSAYIIIQVRHRVAHFYWAPSIHQLQPPQWTDYDGHAYFTVKQLLAAYSTDSNAKFVHIASFKSFSELPLLFPEHFI